MTPLYLVIKTQTTHDAKPNYAATSLVPSGLPFPAAHTPSPFNPIRSHHIARNIPHTTADVTENYDVRISWEHDTSACVSVVASSNDKEAAGIVMHEAVDVFVAEAAAELARGEEHVKRRTKTTYDGEYDLVFAAGMRTGKGGNVGFEMFCVEIAPGVGLRYGVYAGVDRGEEREGVEMGDALF
ncbi:hypothetical protein DPSP01_008622 [Paraphaeosphaeria sporulosa]|uniref:Uncharacterized protein n=1 Tax=Paraphaeosphaeria sporulosa TaxID=1460663 RepID=A0A177BV13_9PLEO|nr:uncharacterized protein CC84DRAFT_1222999 [Paraphaeosphaeria sporulosa]OAF99313.1 hypothetical protein CC84DRAFT_1222999 [Paraphaeosphaeria sporulosa]